MQTKGKNTSLKYLGAAVALGLSAFVTGCGKPGPAPLAASAEPSAPGSATLASLPNSPASGQGQGGYQVTQGTVNTSDSGGNSGPVRMARISFLQGTVSWRTDGASGWSGAAMNLPLRQGAQISVNSDSKAEVQFDDGSRMRLGNGTVATLQTLYSDDKGEFTEVKLNNGLASFTLVSKLSVFQIDTPVTSIKAQGPCYLRVGIGSGVECCCRRGSAQVQGPQGTAQLQAGQYMNIASPSASYQVSPAPQADSWDQFSDSRDEAYAHPSQYVPANVSLMSEDLDTSGDWQPDPHYGHVWCPRGVNADWRPYHDGHWTWVDPYGWTWVGNESWGWAPYHYGSWVHASYGWGWAPGPAQQYWSPAVVSFSSYNGVVAWVPLAPYEMRYPSAISFGFQGGDWALNFSIGGAAAFYGGGVGFVVGRPWSNGYINRSYNVYNSNRINNYYGGSYASNNGFVPSYGRSAFAITRTTNAGFAGGGRFQNGGASDPAIFRHGQSFATARGGPAAFGPAGVRPTRAAFTPSRSFGASRPSAAIMQRAVVRAAIPTAARRGSGAFGRATAPSSRTATVVRAGTARGATPNGIAARSAMRSNVTGAASRANAARASVARTKAARTNSAARANTARTNGMARANTARTNGMARANTARTNSVARAQTSRATNARANAARTNNTARANRARTAGTARMNMARTNSTARANMARTRSTARANTARTNSAARQKTSPAPRQQRQAAPARQRQAAPARQPRQAAPVRQKRQSAPARQPRQAAPPRQPRQSAPPRQQRQAPPPRGGASNDKKRGGG